MSKEEIKKEISFVIPVYNEKDNIAGLHQEIKDVCEREGYIYEIIFIDDGSTDGSEEVARTLYPLKYIHLRKNFGQTAAIDAGIRNSQYNYIVTMDGDRQNDPADVPRMFEYMIENDLDIVSGWRKNRKDSVSKKVYSRFANFLRGILVKDGIHDSGCSLKIYKKECFEQITLYGEMHRFIPALCIIKGYTVGEIIVNHRPRTAGVTKYNYKRAFKGFVDMISLWFWGKFASRPLHLFGFLGITTGIAAVVCGIISIFLYLERGKISDTGWLTIVVLLIITTLQFFIFGLLSDVLSKLYRETTRDKAYVIKSIYEQDK